MKCKCGCDSEAAFYISGVGFGGDAYYNEPACWAATEYCEESAAILELPFSKWKPLPGADQQ
jgi:hypothetical protein